MFPGQCTLCLKTKDLVSMRSFYESLGMKMHFEQPTAVLLNNGDLDLALMTFPEKTSLNFRGADVFRIHELATATGLKFESTAVGVVEHVFEYVILVDIGVRLGD